MFVVSLLYTLGLRAQHHPIQADAGRGDHQPEHASTSLVSVTAGLLYSGVLVSAACFVGDRLRGRPDVARGDGGGADGVVILILSELARERFQKAIDRRFFREKYKFDQAMRKMRLAVGSLVDRATLGRRLLEAAAEVLRLEWGAIYLADGPGEPLAAGRLPRARAPTSTCSTPTTRCVDRLRRSPALRVPHAHGAVDRLRPGHRRHDRAGGRGRQRRWRPTASSPACSCSGRSGAGCRTRTRRWPSSARSARWRRWRCTRRASSRRWRRSTSELRDKVEKIAEQQRRILILQDQLVDRERRRPEDGDGAGRPWPAPTEPEAFDRDQGVGRRGPADDRAWRARWRPARRRS